MSGVEDGVVCVPAVISVECLRKMWALTKEPVEWGGRLLPSHAGGACKVGTIPSLVKGTAIADSLEESERRGKPMRAASTPLHTEVLSSAPSCHQGVLTNMFFHTHPMGTMPVSPPSAADFAAHTILGNSTNWRRHRQINTALLMRNEGLYVYGVQMATLRKWMDKMDAMTEERGPEAVRQLEKTGEPPADIMLAIKREAQQAIDGGYEALERQAHPTPTDNGLLPVLRAHGFWYRFYSAPFDRDLEIPSAGRVLRA